MTSNQPMIAYADYQALEAEVERLRAEMEALRRRVGKERTDEALERQRLRAAVVVSTHPENDHCSKCGHLRFQHTKDEKKCLTWCGCTGFAVGY